MKAETATNGHATAIPSVAEKRTLQNAVSVLKMIECIEDNGITDPDDVSKLANEASRSIQVILQEMQDRESESIIIAKAAPAADETKEDDTQTYSSNP